jgi:hypothetical protein
VKIQTQVPEQYSVNLNTSVLVTIGLQRARPCIRNMQADYSRDHNGNIKIPLTASRRATDPAIDMTDAIGLLRRQGEAKR